MILILMGQGRLVVMVLVTLWCKARLWPRLFEDAQLLIALLVQSDHSLVPRGESPLDVEVMSNPDP